MSTTNNRWENNDVFAPAPPRDSSGSSNWRSRDAPVAGGTSRGESGRVTATRLNSVCNGGLSGGIKLSGAVLQRSTSVPSRSAAEQNASNNNTSNSAAAYSKREAGFIEKILASYGFVQGTDREVRLFFHFSEFKGNLDDLNIGDKVEFRESCDKRTGKPVAVSVTKHSRKPSLRISTSSVSSVTAPASAPLPQTPQQQQQQPTTQYYINDVPVTGVVLEEPKPPGAPLLNGHCGPKTLSMDKNGGGEAINVCSLGGRDEVGEVINTGTPGRVMYEQSGETFFLLFTLEDIEPGQSIKMGDKVEFYISTDERLGNLRALCVRKPGSNSGLILPPQFSSILPPSDPNKLYTGSICSLKESYGFIDRADIVREIFFHFSEFPSDLKETKMKIGTDVQFNIHWRHNKVVACNIVPLPEGSVIFEDIRPEVFSGKVHKSTAQAHLLYGSRGGGRGGNQGPGVSQGGGGSQGGEESGSTLIRIVYEDCGSEKEIIYSDQDVVALDFTLFDGDVIEFQLATDRRDKHERATNIRLIVDESFRVSSEKREKGFVTTIKDGYGFIRCVDRDARMFFHFKEKLNVDVEIQVHDEVEFTVIQDPSDSSRLVATRIAQLVRGTIPVVNGDSEKLTGTVEKEAGTQLAADADPGIIMYDVSGTKQMIPYSSAVVDGELPRLKETVEFEIVEDVKNKTRTAANVRVFNHMVGGGGGSGAGVRERGNVVTLKESFGFIELADHEREIFFHFSCLEGDPNDLDLGDEVEFTIPNNPKSSRICAENIRKLNRTAFSINSASDETILPGILDGKVVATLRVSNPDQTEYCGLIHITDIDTAVEVYPFSIMSLVDKRDLPQKGEIVRFQVCEMRNPQRRRAVRVAPVRKYVHCKVDCVKDRIVYLDYDVDDGRKLSFPVSDLQDLSLWPLGGSAPPLAGGVQLFDGDDVELVVVHSLRGAWSVHNVRKICERPRPERLISRLKSVSDDGIPRVMTTRQPRGPDGSIGFKGGSSNPTAPPSISASPPGCSGDAPRSNGGGH